MMAEWTLYMIRLANGFLYTGIAEDVERRFKEHREGGRKAAKYLRGKGPLTLAFQQKIGTRSQALKAEAAVKKLPKKEKERIVQGVIPLPAPSPGNETES